MSAVLAAYPVVSLAPFNWTAPTVLTNAAVRLDGGGLRFPATGIARSASPPAWVPLAIRSASLDVDLRVWSARPDQYGPARIFTVSRDLWRRNLTVGQDGDTLVVRLRTPWSDTNGIPEVRVPRVFALPAWVDLRVVIEPGSLQVEVDGQRSATRVLPATPLAPWDPRFAVALGNEHTYDRAWVGDIERAAVTTDGTSHDYAAPDSPLILPEHLWLLHQPPQLVPFRGANPLESGLNVLFYLPLGLLLGGRRGARRMLPYLLVALAMSAGLEALQVLIPSRQPSVNDVIMNGIGAGLGLVAVKRWGKVRREA